MRIAVIDDRPDTSQVIRIFLSAPDLEVEAFTDPYRLLEALKTHGFDLLITDISMPALDGYELLRLARALDPTLPAIALTGRIFSDDHEMALAAGFSAYIEKPINDWDAFAEVVRKNTRKT